MEPIPLPDSLRVGISMRPSGKIAPALIDDPNRQPDAIIVTYEEFVVIAQRLKDGLLKGTIVPSSEYEIPKLMYSEGLPWPLECQSYIIPTRAEQEVLRLVM